MTEDLKNIGDEFVEDTTQIEQETEELLYDLVLPPGVPHKLIIEARDNFNLEVTVRKCALKTIDVESENLLVLRGSLEDVNKAHDYIYDKMSKRFNYKREPMKM